MKSSLPKKLKTNAYLAEQYIQDVKFEVIPSCKWVRLCVERHICDLKKYGEKECNGIWFDRQAGEHVIDFFHNFLVHSKGEWAGQLFFLQPWQQFILWCIFGWKNGQYRRFRTAYLEVPRKNGKTTLMSGIGIYLLDADGEPGAEIYSAATKRDQARISHGEACRMVKASPFLAKRITIYRDNLHVVKTSSKFEPLGADSDTMDGLNVHGALIDELHAHKNRGVWDVLETATGSRRQSLQVAITTSGHDRHSICWEQNQYVQKILEGIINDETYWGIIYTLDKTIIKNENGSEVEEDEDYKDENLWIKANPNLGVSVKIDDLQRIVNKASQVPSAENSCKRLRFDIWTESITKWISSNIWNACTFSVDPVKLKGRACYGGLDLSSNTDLSAWVMVFPPLIPLEEGGKYEVLCRFFLPEDNMRERVHHDKVPYDVWVKQGYITTTPGNIIDYDFILDQIEKDMADYEIRELAFDRWGSQKITTDLQNIGFEVEGKKNLIQFGQGFGSMSAPTKELEKMVLAKEIAHGGNPVLSWMMSNIAIRTDPAGNKKPDKEKSTEKIDGIVALIMAIGRSMLNKGPVISVYNSLSLDQIKERMAF